YILCPNISNCESFCKWISRI
ncbi:hypothetical protein A5865_003251, partial [Enterococcus sp. 12E11_DIV0728]